MQVFNGFGYLLNDVSAQILAEVGQSHDLVEELASGAELQNDVVVLSGFREIDQLDNIGVVEVAHNLNLLEDICAL
jgi:hypothetical protein